MDRPVYYREKTFSLRRGSAATSIHARAREASAEFVASRISIETDRSI
jgi:hypothetical protein